MIRESFCRSKCQYCDFYSVTEKHDKLWDGYLDAICAHIKESGPLAPGYKVDTIYFGGGTPSFYGSDGLATILDTIRRNFDVDINAEITLECNTDSVNDRMLHRLRAEGVNRISLGMQSACDAELAEIGRVHTTEQVRIAVETARAAKFDNLSLDLIYGLPHQTRERWQENLAAAVALKPDHLSCYGLKVEGPLWLL